MNILMGKENAAVLSEKFVVLELDTFKFEEGNVVTAYCTIDNIPLESLANVPEIVARHDLMISSFKEKNWTLCQELVNRLTGEFNGEVDSFYESILNRIASYLENDPGDDWTHIIPRKLG